MKRNETKTISSIIAAIVLALSSGCASMPSVSVPIFDDFRVEYGGGD
jgi:hypothetical protein